ncbi:M1 family metallopeptidase [Flavilitoribacter nigricans]|uniref:Peptidase M1 membrane alanine aminopeptidase domain-containing protein n=1 Tax=Flavilitoribacter nigricans (strain ATCC 23147 / DSM 23189 / NBRC 102662 / NCIMB 1420 / SS-2) TaxID=1122177 RepID=A0A2D0NCC7_FLAN2|nr:M1 family metallopeptidase [Flavilitoribacter nigricans]PHN06048.1 hypothetical protein CRP01_13845 [Flavilitoribacter nigricans DSM 23189 = NBRC 102662]
MKHTITTLLFLLILVQWTALGAQENRFFMPSEIAAAYENGTRSYDGKPGQKYWQNTVDYDIDVAVTPSEKKLEGSEKVVYYNNSPDALNRIVIRLYHDLFREANPRAYRVSPDDITQGVELTKITIDGTDYDPANGRQVRRSGTNTIIQLQEPLAAGASLEMNIDWAQQVPETTIRTGAYDSTSFFMAYWYPQVAVYDDVFGWDDLTYDFSAEFYNNLGNYDVRITVPDNFTVLSTGVLQNAGEVLAEDSYERYQQAKTSTDPVVIVSPEDVAGDFHHRSGTWHYKAEEVSDFSFALSDHFSWDAASQEVDGRQVLISSFYPADGAEACKMVTPNQQKTMKYFSESMPGIPYPYPEFTTFVSSIRGGGGMETPMMANNGGPGLGVTVHEMFHTYFPMYVRTNEKRYAWMDEGWADFNTSYVVKRYFQEDQGLLFGDVSGGVVSTLGTISDLPLITSTQFTDGTNYGYSAYPLPAFLYTTLHHHLGEEVFLRCYREYIRRWAKKSPTPYDFFYTFENVSGQDLSWFWKPWFFEFGTVDVELTSYKNGKLSIKNNGNRPVPIVVNVKYQDGSTEEITAGAGAWKADRTYQMKIPRKKEVTDITVGNGIPDAKPLDNIYPSLRQQYADFSIPADITGTYHIAAFQADIFVEKKDNFLYLRVPGAGLRMYLKPKSATEFSSLDGSVDFKFDAEAGKYRAVNFQYYGYDITGEKR